MGDARPGLAERQLAAQFLVDIQQGVDRPVADRVGGVLKPRLRCRLHDRQQPFSRDEEHAAVFRVGDGVNLTHAPRLPHVGAAGEHAAVEVGLDADDAEHRIGLAQGVLGHFPNPLLNRVDGSQRFDVMGDGDTEWQAVAELAVALDVGGAGVTVADGGDAHGVVVLEEGEQPLDPVQVGRPAASGLAFDVAGATAEDAGRLAGLRVLLGVTGAAVDHFEVLADAAELQGQCVERGVRPGGEDHGILRRRLV